MVKSNLRATLNAEQKDQYDALTGRKVPEAFCEEGVYEATKINFETSLSRTQFEEWLKEEDLRNLEKADSRIFM